MLKLPLSDGQEVPLVDQIVSGLTAMIDDRRLACGRKLPSIREFASSNGVSKTTVVEAYDRLVALGRVASKHKVGFFVAGPRPPLELTERIPPYERDINPLWSLRQSLSAAPDMPKPASGHLPPSLLPDERIRRALRDIARSPQANLVSTSDALGYLPMRAQLQIEFAARGIDAGPGAIMLTEGALNAIDLVCRLMVQPGDTVFVDDPGYFNVVANLAAHRANVVGIPYRANGPDLDVFAAEARRCRPRLYITNSAIQNPTGATLSPAIAHRLLRIAEEFDIAIVEDDIYGDFEEQPSPRLAALDQLDRVFYVGSYTKSLTAAARCGWVAARPDWIEGLIDVKLATLNVSNELAAQLVYRLLTEGGYRKHMQQVRSKLRVAALETERRLARLGIRTEISPPGGIFLWTRLPDNRCSADVARRSWSAGIGMAPGNVFSVSRAYGSHLRFNVARSRDERIWSFLARALAEGGPTAEPTTRTL